MINNPDFLQAVAGRLQEETFVGYAYIDARLIVVRMFEYPIRIIGFDGDLRNRIIVYAYGNALALCIAVRRLRGFLDIRVVEFVATEYVKLLVRLAQLGELRKNVVACFYAYSHCVFADGRFVERRIFLRMRFQIV